MSPKVIVFFALLAVVFAEKPHVGFRIPPFDLTQIVGGEEAPEHYYPFIVSLQWGYSANSMQHFCAGSILGPNDILTAAHCIEAIPPGTGIFAVKAGKHSIGRTENTEQTSEVKKTFVHEGYQGGVGPYDFGVLKIEPALKWTNEVQPINLPAQGSKPTGTPILCGWGSTSPNGALMPDKLQHAKLEYVDIPECDDAVRKLTGSSPVHETNVCTGPLTGGRSACSGDSGGPLFEQTSQGPILTGVVSWGIIPCGTTGAPSVYGGVSNFNSWIVDKMSK